MADESKDGAAAGGRSGQAERWHFSFKSHALVQGLLFVAEQTPSPKPGDRCVRIWQGNGADTATGYLRRRLSKGQKRNTGQAA
jgi:hypothetical protein